MKKVLLITALVFGLGVAGFATGPFSGSWATDVTIVTPQTPVLTVLSVLTVNYTISGWTFGSVSRFTEAGWVRQDFIADGAIGAFTFENHLRFVPAIPEFTHLWSAAGVSIAGVDLSSRLLIVRGAPCEVDKIGSGFRAGFSAPVEDLTFAAGAYFGVYRFDTTFVPTVGMFRCNVTGAWLRPVVSHANHIPEFRGLDVDITMPFYTTTLTIDVDFTTCNGFQDITFSVTRFPLGIPQFELDLRVGFEIDKKDVTITPRFTIGEWMHFQPHITIDWDAPYRLEALRLEGLSLVWPVTDAVRFRYFLDTRYGWPHIVPSLNIPTVGWTRFRQMVELRYDGIRCTKELPITLTMAGRWVWARELVPVVPATDPVTYVYAAVDMPMFPDRIDIDLSVDVLPGFAIRTGVDFGFPLADLAWHAVSFGFTVTW